MQKISKVQFSNTDHLTFEQVFYEDKSTILKISLALLLFSAILLFVSTISEFILALIPVLLLLIWLIYIYFKFSRKKQDYKNGFKMVDQAAITNKMIQVSEAEDIYKIELMDSNRDLGLIKF
jgi:AAA+ ATPase superfamily predicted ATPase